MKLKVIISMSGSSGVSLSLSLFASHAASVSIALQYSWRQYRCLNVAIRNVE
jgi:hypothetical protein